MNGCFTVNPSAAFLLIGKTKITATNYLRCGVIAAIQRGNCDNFIIHTISNKLSF